MIDGSHAILLGETYPPFVVDFGTGAIAQLPASLSLTPPRDYATITPFGSGALIAGGRTRRPAGSRSRRSSSTRPARAARRDPSGAWSSPVG